MHDLTWLSYWLCCCFHSANALRVFKQLLLCDHEEVSDDLITLLELTQSAPEENLGQHTHPRCPTPSYTSLSLHAIRTLCGWTI